MAERGLGAGAVDAPARPAARSTVAVRDRILAAGAELFARRGIRAVGVDAIVSRAGVAKASFYHHFASKDDLIEAWLRSADARWLDDVIVATERRTDDPEGRIFAFFEALSELVRDPNFDGCPYLNTAAELRDPDEGPRPAVLEFTAEVQAYLRKLAEAAGLRNPEVVAVQLQLLTAGALSLSVAGRDPGPALGEAVEAVIRAARPA